MSTPETVKAALQAVIDNANETTGKTDTTVTDAVASLVEGYGAGGGEDQFLSVVRAGKLNITSIVLPDDLDVIGDSIFENFSNLNISLPRGLKSIGTAAFSGCGSLQLTELPDGLQSLGVRVFAGCPKITPNSVPTSLTTIPYYTFRYCTGITRFTLHSGITKIERWVFQGCTNMTEVVFEGKPTSMGSPMFDNCVNLTSIKVPWAEGEVANAPWGATNATIIYNYTGEESA